MLPFFLTFPAAIACKHSVLHVLCLCPIHPVIQPVLHIISNPIRPIRPILKNISILNSIYSIFIRFLTILNTALGLFAFFVFFASWGSCWIRLALASASLAQGLKETLTVSLNQIVSKVQIMKTGNIMERSKGRIEILELLRPAASQPF